MKIKFHKFLSKNMYLKISCQVVATVLSSFSYTQMLRNISNVNVIATSFFLAFLSSAVHKTKYFEECWQPNNFGDHQVSLHGQ